MSLKSTLLILFIGFILPLTAQNISINKIPLLDYLPVSAIHRIFQDSEGYIWYGTVDGLCRDDGYTIQVFRSGLDTPDLFVSNEISCIAEDRYRKLWLGTVSGLYILDKTDYRIRPLGDSELADKNILAVYAASDYSVWVSVTGMLYQYASDGTLLKKIRVRQNSSEEQVGCLSEDREGNLWMTSWQGAVYCISKGSDALRSFPSSGEQVYKTFIVQDRDKSYFWIGTWGKGLIRFHPDAPADSMYIYQAIPRNHMNKADGACLYMKQDHVYGYFWVTGQTDLFAFRQQESGMLEQLDAYSFLPRVNKMLNEIIEDDSGNLWVSAFDRESFIIDLKDRFLKKYGVSVLRQYIGSNPAIMAICEDDDGVFWLLQERMGLCTYNAKTEALKCYTDFPQTMNLDLHAVVTIGKSRLKGKLWVAPLFNGVIYLMSQQNLNMCLHQEIHLSPTVQGPGNVQVLYEDRSGSLWIGTTRGVFVYSPESRELRRIESVAGKVSAITQTVDEALWVCTEEGCLYRIKSPETIGVFHLQKDFMAMDATSDGVLWLGTKQGNVFRYVPDTGELGDYSGVTGMTGRTIYKIVVDKYNHLWIGSNQKLTEFNPRNGAYRNYLTSDEEIFLNRFLPRSVYKNRDGVIYFAGIPGFISFTPSHYLESIPKNVKVHITSISVSGRPVRYGLEDLSSEKKDLELPPDVQNLEIRFSSLDHLHANKIRYAYQLKGVDPGWVYIGDGRNSAFYNQLSKGKYLFRVKATDENGLWSNRIEEFTIYRLPAFYETWWAYTFYMLLVIAVLWGMLYLYQQRMKEQNEKKLSERVTQMKLRYFTNVSHELLTPLTTISCVVDDLEDSDKSGYRAGVRLLQANVFRLRRLLQQVLDLRKLDSGNMVLKVSQGEIVSFVREICNTGFSALIRKKRIRFSFTSVPEQLYGCFDKDKLDKIVYNLLSNAFKYTPEGKSIWVDIKTEYQENTIYAKVTVGDEGVGIAAKELPRIFVRFYNNSYSSGTDSSNGVGLSLVKDLVELHHGSIAVESQRGKGSVFTIRIPVNRESYPVSEFLAHTIVQEQVLQSVPEEKSGEENGMLPVEKQAKILIVEDNEELLSVMQDRLLRQYEVFTATDGMEALEVLKNQDVDVVISDVMMPNMDGWELCRQIREDVKTSHIIVILLTAKTQAEDQIDSYRAGANAYMPKPFEMRVLIARLENLLRERQEMQQRFRSTMRLEISDLEVTSLDEQFIRKAVATVEEHLAKEDFDVTFLADRVNVSRSTLSRKLKNLTGFTPLEFVRHIKMKHAKQMLGDKNLSISEVAYTLGYDNRKYFTSCFKDEFGMTPSEYRRTMDEA